MLKRTLKMQDAQVRERDGAKYLEGYFAVFNKPYQVCENWVETIAPGAFRRFLESGMDAKCLWNHNHDIVLGSTGNGTATLREDHIGLWGSVLINEKDQDALNAYARVERGDVDGCSFGFDIGAMEEAWNGNEYRTEITEVWPLYEYSPCTFPAYADTSIHARAQEDLQAARQKRLDAWREEMRSRLRK